MDKLTEADNKKIYDATVRELLERPPTIALIGVSGVGKSSTINTMFKTHLPTSDTVACTKDFWDTDVELALMRGNARNQSIRLRVIDAPGLGEDISKDPEYLGMYKENLGRCDVIMWILAARNRAIALDQHYLRKLSDFSEKMVFGLNQVDLVEPLNWNARINLPSHEQLRNIEAIAEDRRNKLRNVLGKEDITLVPFSAKVRYRLGELFTAMIGSCRSERAWIFDALRNFDFDDWLTTEAREELGRIRQTGVRNRKIMPRFWPFF